MISRLSLLSIALSIVQSNCQQIQSASDLSSNDLKAKKTVKQWGQWPAGQWDPSLWPSYPWDPTQWPSFPPSPPNSWEPANAPPHGQWQRPPTIYPPLPDWPTGGTPPHSKPRPSRRPTVTRPTTELTTEPETETDPETGPEMEEVTTKPTPRPTPSRPKPTPKPTSKPKPPSQRPPSTSSPNIPIASNETDDHSGITVKSCGLSHIPQVLIGNKIVSGKVAKGGEFPWQVLLKIYTARGPMQCGGAILNNKWILTAAHCVSNERNGEPTAQRVDVTAGVNNRLQGGPSSQVRTADCVIQHESWKGQNGKFKNDIALLRLPADKPLDINYEKGGHVNGICLPSQPNSEYNGKARIAGWGLTKDRGTPSDVLMYTDVTILTNEKCKTYPYPVPIADSMICQGVDRTAPCQGDSGGPLLIAKTDSKGVHRITELGIVSFGPGECANSQTPNAIYTKVSYFLKWIEKQIKANSGQKCMSRELITADKWVNKPTNGTEELIPVDFN